MNIIKPKKLQTGDTIGILSVSGDIKEPEKVSFAAKYFESKGYNVVLSDTTYKKDRYFAGSDKERAMALQDFFLDDNINAIICSRGGYGAIRIIDKIDYEIIKQNPKIFVGYSDITAFLAMMYKKTGMITFHGPMAIGDFGAESVDHYSSDLLFKTLTSGINTIRADEELLKVYNPGVCNGVLWGGNLATLASLAGKNFIPDEKFVLFLEDVHEPVYKIDRMIIQLLNVEQFKNNLVGLVVGEFTGLDSEEYFNDLVSEIAQNLKIPASGRFRISHESKKLTVPFGVKCSFDAQQGIVDIIGGYLQD